MRAALGRSYRSASGGAVLVAVRPCVGRPRPPRRRAGELTPSRSTASRAQAERSPSTRTRPSPCPARLPRAPPRSCSSALLQEAAGFFRSPSRVPAPGGDWAQSRSQRQGLLQVGRSGATSSTGAAPLGIRCAARSPARPTLNIRGVSLGTRIGWAATALLAVSATGLLLTLGSALRFSRSKNPKWEAKATAKAKVERDEETGKYRVKMLGKSISQTLVSTAWGILASGGSIATLVGTGVSAPTISVAAQVAIPFALVGFFAGQLKMQAMKVAAIRGARKAEAEPCRRASPTAGSRLAKPSMRLGRGAGRLRRRGDQVRRARRAAHAPWRLRPPGGDVDARPRAGHRAPRQGLLGLREARLDRRPAGRRRPARARRDLPLDGADPVEPARGRALRARRDLRCLPPPEHHNARASLQPDEAKPRRRARPRPHHHGRDPRPRPRRARVPEGPRRPDPDDGPDVLERPERDHRREGDPLRAARDRRDRHRRPPPRSRPLPLRRPRPARRAGSLGRARRDDPRRRGGRPSTASPRSAT